jgi:glycosyltransferase involved in cell wall biosynthesis
VKILFLDQFQHPGGAQLCLRDLMQAAERRGARARLLVPGSGLPPSLASYNNGSKSMRDFAVFGIDTLRAAAAIRCEIRNHGADLVYVNGPRLLAAAQLAGSPFVFHAHSRVSGSSAQWIARRALRGRCTAIFASSRFVAEPLYGTAPLRVVYNGVADQGFAARSFSAPALTVGILGRIAPEKGHLDFVRAADRIASVFPAAKFVIHGAAIISRAGYEAEVRRAASHLNFEFHGWTDCPAPALHSIDILAVPSAPLESTTRVIPEAFSAGTPVVAYRAGGIPEIVRNGRTGVLCDPNPAALSDSILALMGCRDRLRRLAVNARIEFERQFHQDRFTAEICGSLAALFEAPSSGRGERSQRAALRATGSNARA